MNDDRNFRQRKPILEQLFATGLPVPVIAEIVGLSKETLAKDLKKMGGNKKFPRIFKSITAGMPAVLASYAMLSQKTESLSEIESKTKEVCKKYLQVENIILYLNGVERTLSSFGQVEDPGNVLNENQRQLLSDIGVMPYMIMMHYDDLLQFSNPFGGSRSWNEYLKDIHSKRIELPSSKEFKSDKNYLALNIADKHIRLGRNSVFPTIGQDMPKIIDETLKNLDERARNIVSLFYGIGSEKMKLKDIAAKFDRSEQRIREIRESAVRKMRHNSAGAIRENFRWLFREVNLSTSERVTEIKIKKEYEEVISKLTEISGKFAGYKHVIGSIIMKAEGDSNYHSSLLKSLKEAHISFLEDGDHYSLAVLNKPLRDIGLSCRLLNCCRAADLFFIWQTAQYHKMDFIKFRNFGRKSLEELEKLLSQYGLSFGMEFPAELKSLLKTVEK